MIDPRAHVCLLTFALLVTPLAAEAQQAEKVYRVGILSPNPRPSAGVIIPTFQALAKGLRDRGYVEDGNLIVERRFADGRPERIPVVAAELASLNVDMIVVGVDRTAVAVREAAPRIPLVMASGGE